MPLPGWTVAPRSRGIRPLIHSLLAACLGMNAMEPVGAQGVTTAAMAGTVVDDAGNVVSGARASVVNTTTGYTASVDVRDGRFLVQGLETGGPYTLTVRRIGAIAHERRGLMLSLGQRLELNITLVTAARLDTVFIVDSAVGGASVGVRAGITTTITDSMLRRMPALNRDVLDFARLVPQVGTRFGGLSGGGVGYRLNGYLIDGVSERMINGNGAISGTAAGKPISIEAVREYQVLLSPYDVRYGEFAGALVNAVTRGGTNELRSSAFGYVRNEKLARETPFLRGTAFDRKQFGFTLGGPIVRDRAHFFIASEFQTLAQPAAGPHVDAGGSAAGAPVTAEEVDRMATLLRGHGAEPGSGGRLVRTNPNANVFARVDFGLPGWRTRGMLRHNHSDVDNTFFARPFGTGRFPLTSNAWTQGLTRSSTAMQLFTQLGRGGLNELLVSYANAPQRATRFARSPLIEVSLPGSRLLVAGPPEVGQGSGSHQRTIDVSDHITLDPLGAHNLTLGVRAELFSFHNISTRGQFGRWRFASLDALERGEASSFRVERDFGSATRRLRGGQFAAYLSDTWTPSDRLTLTAGLRADMLAFESRPGANPDAEAIYGRRTTDFPRPRIHWSPRAGFTWDADDSGKARVRGGAGVFTGRGPLAWVHQSLRFDGRGTRTLSCVGGPAIVPRFVADPARMPTECADGGGLADGPLNLVSSRLRLAEMLRSSLAFERTLPGGVEAAVEAMHTRTMSDFLVANLRLSGPRGQDAQGRVLYGTFDAAGRATPALVSNRFPEVVDLRNHSAGYSWSVTGRAEKRFGERFELGGSYTRSLVRDVQSLTIAGPVLTIAHWESGRMVSGRHDDLSTSVSAYEIPDRIVVTGGWRSPSARWPTIVSLYYIGESGQRFTYNDSTAGGLGDLNADGTNANDPIYVPRDATDPAEIAVGGTPDEALREREALEAFIRGSPCLRRQRGRIIERNSCIAPFTHTLNGALRQSLGLPGEHALSVDVEVFNVLNLLNSRWGLQRTPVSSILKHVGQTSEPTPRPLFRFDPATRRTDTDNIESAYQIQLAVRYTFD